MLRKRERLQRHKGKEKTREIDKAQAQPLIREYESRVRSSPELHRSYRQGVNVEVYGLVLSSLGPSCTAVV